MQDNLFISGVRTTNGALADISLAGGRIAAILAAGSPAPAGARIIAGAGRLAVPALVEAHAHFDKTLWGQPWRPNSAGPTLRDYIDN